MRYTNPHLRYTRTPTKIFAGLIVAEGIIARSIPSTF